MEKAPQDRPDKAVVDRAERPFSDSVQKTAVRFAATEPCRSYRVWLLLGQERRQVLMVLALTLLGEATLLFGLPHAAGADGLDDEDYPLFLQPRQFVNSRVLADDSAQPGAIKIRVNRRHPAPDFEVAARVRWIDD